MTSSIRFPSAAVKINGAVIPAWTDWEVDNNTHFAADTFRVRFATSGLPAAYNAAWMTSQADLVVEIRAGFPANHQAVDPQSLTSLIIGRADEMAFDPASGVIELAGRDYSARFSDNRTSEVYKNLTVTQVVQKLASRRNLSAQVTAPNLAIGVFYEIDKARLSGERTEWDILCWLARELQSIVYVKGTTLYFAPAPTIGSVTPYAVTWTPPSASAPRQSTAVSLVLERNLTLARDIKVTVQSWNARQKKVFTATSSAPHTATTGKGSGAFASTPQVFNYVYPGLSQDQARQKADEIRNQISRHEMKLRATLPGDVTLDVHGLVRLTGTGTAFDQIYYPDSVTRTMSNSGGFAMTLQARNAAPETIAET